MLKKTLKWIGMGFVTLLSLIIIASAIIYVAFPIIEFDASREVTVSQEEMFSAFMDFDHWYDYWDIDELFLPNSEIGIGSVIRYSAVEGNATLEISEFIPDELVRFDMVLEGIPGDGYFIMRFEPSKTGTRVTASNHIETSGPWRILHNIFAIIGASNSYYDNMIAEVERVALEKYE